MTCHTHLIVGRARSGKTRQPRWDIEQDAVAAVEQHQAADGGRHTRRFERLPCRTANNSLLHYLVTTGRPAGIHTILAAPTALAAYRPGPDAQGRQPGGTEQFSLPGEEENRCAAWRALGSDC